jgi:hypothetical protein
MWSHLYRLLTVLLAMTGVGFHKDSDYRLTTLDTVHWSKLLLHWTVDIDIVRVNTEIDVVLQTMVSGSHDVETTGDLGQLAFMPFF